MPHHQDYITTTHGMSGYFAVHVWYNPEGFFEPYDTGFGRYQDKIDAIREAKDWATAEDLPYKD